MKNAKKVGYTNKSSQEHPDSKKSARPAQSTEQNMPPAPDIVDATIHSPSKRAFLRHLERQKRKETDAMRKKILQRLKSDGVGQVVMHILYHAAHRIVGDLKDLKPAEQEARLAALFGPNGLAQDGDEYVVQGFYDAVEVMEGCGCLWYLRRVLDSETFVHLISN